MARELALVTVHGMGRTPTSYAVELFGELESRLGSAAAARIHMGTVYYQDLLQPPQERVWERMAARRLDGDRIRQLLLFGFGDAASLEHRAHLAGRPYHLAQQRIRAALELALSRLDDPSRPLLIVTQSLGGHVISNYLWDSARDQGIWAHEPLTGRSRAELDFLRGRTTRCLFTTGCNIPIFVAGFEPILPIDAPHPDFEWQNYYDRDDPLGWPLRPLGPEYAQRVTADVQMNAGGLFTSWTAFSHTHYWCDRDFLEPLVERIRALLG